MQGSSRRRCPFLGEVLDDDELVDEWEAAGFARLSHEPQQQGRTEHRGAMPAQQERARPAVPKYPQHMQQLVNRPLGLIPADVSVQQVIFQLLQSQGGSLAGPATGFKLFVVDVLTKWCKQCCDDHAAPSEISISSLLALSNVKAWLEQLGSSLQEGGPTPATYVSALVAVLQLPDVQETLGLMRVEAVFNTIAKSGLLSETTAGALVASASQTSSVSTHGFCSAGFVGPQSTAGAAAAGTGGSPPEAQHMSHAPQSSARVGSYVGGSEGALRGTMRQVPAQQKQESAAAATQGMPRLPQQAAGHMGAELQAPATLQGMLAAAAADPAAGGAARRAVLPDGVAPAVPHSDPPPLHADGISQLAGFRPPTPNVLAIIQQVQQSLPADQAAATISVLSSWCMARYPETPLRCMPISVLLTPPDVSAWLHQARSRMQQGDAAAEIDMLALARFFTLILVLDVLNAHQVGLLLQLILDSLNDADRRPQLPQPAANTPVASSVLPGGHSTQGFGIAGLPAPPAPPAAAGVAAAEVAAAGVAAAGVAAAAEGAGRNYRSHVQQVVGRRGPDALSELAVQPGANNQADREAWDAAAVAAKNAEAQQEAVAQEQSRQRAVAEAYQIKKAVEYAVLQEQHNFSSAGLPAPRAAGVAAAPAGQGVEDYGSHEQQGVESQQGWCTFDDDQLAEQTRDWGAWDAMLAAADSAEKKTAAKEQARHRAAAARALRLEEEAEAARTAQLEAAQRVEEHKAKRDARADRLDARRAAVVPQAGKRALTPGPQKPAESGVASPPHCSGCSRWQPAARHPMYLKVAARSQAGPPCLLQRRIPELSEQ